MKRQRNPEPHAAPWALLLLALLVAAPGSTQAQGIHAALLPSPLGVAPNDEFDLDIVVTQAGSVFNGFDATITYDPAALQFLSNAQGAYMVGACPPTPFYHVFTPAVGTLYITDVFLCNGVALPGPGQLYRLHFKAASTPQVTTVSFGSAQFYNDGLFVNPLVSTNATIAIGIPLDAGGTRSGFKGLRLAGAPNPFRGQTSITVESGGSGWQELHVSDLQGRWVRHLDSGTFAAGIRRVAWDGRDDSGRSLPAGVYLVSARGPAGSARLRVALLR